MATIILLNNFMHDFSAAGWLFGTVLLWLVLKKHADSAEIIVDLLKTILLLMRICFFGIVVFGVIRALAYEQYEWNALAGDSQVTLLIVKHILFFGIFIPGCVGYHKTKQFIKKAENG